MTDRLPDFTRLAWVSSEARTEWEPRIAAFIGAWDVIERAAVAAGIRRAALQHAAPGELPGLAAWAAAAGLTALPISIEGFSETAYSQTVISLAPGKPWRYRLVIATPADALTFAAAWADNDDVAVGELLGYPACCRIFFRRVWRTLALVDTTWEMSDDGTDGPPEANPLLRWLGVRVAPHLPCGFRCSETVDFARSLVALGRRLKFDAEMDTALEMLTWPVEWSALHGIAEVRTPICRVVSRTDHSAGERIVRRRGSSYPAEGARGIRFPYRPGPAAKPVPPGELRTERPAPSLPRPWEHDGFTSWRAREVAHRLVLEAARTAPAGAVLDLGCGGGRLVELVAQVAQAPAFGVECDPIRAAVARQRLGADHVIEGDLTGDWPGTPPYGAALVMPGRILEAGAVEGRRLRLRLARTCRAIILYAYGDWQTHHGGLPGWAQAAGFGDATLWEWGPILRGEQVEAFVALSRLTGEDDGRVGERVGRTVAAAEP